jgi:ABC-type multidrug transport system ATPase subunit
MTDAIVVENIAKRFENVEAVSGISFHVAQGELFSFLGPNGAGKTTTINMLTGLARPDAGTIRIGGIDCTGKPRAAQHLVTTHYIEEAERLCDRIAFIVSGRIVRTDSVENLVQPIQDKHVVQIACSNMPEDIQGKLSKFFAGVGFTILGQGLIRVEAKEPVRVGPLIRYIEDRGGEVIEARRMRPSLEDIFVQITGIEADTMRREKEKKGKGQ